MPPFTVCRYDARRARGGVAFAIGYTSFKRQRRASPTRPRLAARPRPCQSAGRLIESRAKSSRSPSFFAAKGGRGRPRGERRTRAATRVAPVSTTFRADRRGVGAGTRFRDSPLRSGLAAAAAPISGCPGEVRIIIRTRS